MGQSSLWRRVLHDRRTMILPMHTRQPSDEAVVQFLELWALLLNDIPHFVSVLCGQEHPNIAAVADAGYPFEKFSFREPFRECKESSADGRC